MVIWTLAKKDLRLLLRDARAMIILLAMPLIFIIVLGVSLGEGFGKKDKLTVSVLNLDRGVPRFFDRPIMRNEALIWLSLSNNPLPGVGGDLSLLGAAGLAIDQQSRIYPPDSWSALVLKDLTEASGLHVELLNSRAEADRLVKSGRRAAVMVLGPNFSKRVQRCSFLASGRSDILTIAACAYPQPGRPVELALSGLFCEGQADTPGKPTGQDGLPLYLLDGINPFDQNGVRFDELDVELLLDKGQETSAAVLVQAAQGSFFRLILPWMIGRAFAKIGDPEFLTLLGNEKQMPTLVQTFLKFAPANEKRALGTGLQSALQNLFPKYNLTAKTWASLTKQPEHTGDGRDKVRRFHEDGTGWLKRGANRYQLLVPSYLVMFTFFLVLTVGWLFVGERRQGTLIRLRAAPLARWQILIGKLIPCYIVSLFQGYFLLLAGKLIFDMSWGPDPLYLIPLVATTSMAAMGLALLVACIARTETQVAVYGTLLVLILAGLSGSLMGDRSSIPESLQQISLFTPHAWALDAYRQLLATPADAIDLSKVRQSCGVLALFGIGFVVVSWMLLRLD